MRIYAAPLDYPLDNSYLPQAQEVMRKHNVQFVAIERCWHVLRDYDQKDWSSVLLDLKNNGEQTRKWFAR